MKKKINMRMRSGDQMEADLLDDMGAIRIVMNSMIIRWQNPDACFEDAYDHIMGFSHHQLQANPMLTKEARAIWDEKHEFPIKQNSPTLNRCRTV